MSAPKSVSQGVTLLRPDVEASDAAEHKANPNPRLLIVDDISDKRDDFSVAASKWSRRTAATSRSN
jgi:hypothetical protein